MDVRVQQKAQSSRFQRIARRPAVLDQCRSLFDSAKYARSSAQCPEHSASIAGRNTTLTVERQGSRLLVDDEYPVVRQHGLKAHRQPQALGLRRTFRHPEQQSSGVRRTDLLQRDRYPPPLTTVESAQNPEVGATLQEWHALPVGDAFDQHPRKLERLIL